MTAARKLLTRFLASGGDGGLVSDDPEYGNVTFLAGFESANENEVVAIGGTGVGGTLSSSQARFGSQSLAISGADESVYSITEPFTIGPSGDLSVVAEAWIYPTSLPATNTTHTVFRTDDDSIVFSLFRNSSTGVVTPSFLFGYSTYGSFFGSFSSANPIVANQWQHIVWTYNAGSLAAAVDGIIVFENSEITVSTSNHTSFSIGGTYGGANGPAGGPFQGFIDEVRITTDAFRYGGSESFPLNGDFTPPTEAFPRAFPPGGAPVELLSDPDVTEFDYSISGTGWRQTDYLSNQSTDFSGEGVLVTDLGGDGDANIAATVFVESGKTYRFTGTTFVTNVGGPLQFSVGWDPQYFSGFAGPSTSVPGAFSVDWTADRTGGVLVGGLIFGAGDSFRLTNTSVIEI